jgi:inorganic pyrophosphatase
VSGAGTTERFWESLSAWVTSGCVEIDRPRGSPHPRYPAVAYPLDYGYLRGTYGGDSEGIDLWIGSLAGREVTGIICTVDVEKRDAEIKVLLGCTEAEMTTLLDFHNRGSQSAMLIRYPG